MPHLFLASVLSVCTLCEREEAGERGRERETDRPCMSFINVKLLFRGRVCLPGNTSFGVETGHKSPGSALLCPQALGLQGLGVYANTVSTGAGGERGANKARLFYGR